MASIKIIQTRIKSAKSIAQITRAMQMFAASRMRRAQEAAEKAKPYQEKIVEAVQLLATNIEPSMHALLSTGNPTGRTLVVLISTNKGLAGGLNTTLFRKLGQWFSDFSKVDFITLGTKGEHFIVRSGATLVADFSKTEFTQSAQAVTELFINNFLSGTYKEVYVVFNQFVNSMKQEPVRRIILPLSLHTPKTEAFEARSEEFSTDFLIEPSPKEVLQSLLPHYVEVQIRSAILEASASEHSARMIAMKNATDNANSLIDEFTLMYNRLRQEKITYEIADMVTARVSME
jgi:F-type H+-transporting ATPase subunit gamma